MQQTAHPVAATHDQDNVRPRRGALILAVAAGLALGTAACGGAQANSAVSAPRATVNVGAGGGSGPVTIGPNGPTQGGSGQRSTGSFSLAFARCMRAHDVPSFPDPNGQPGQLGPASGIDPNSPPFQSAINRPCKSMAPPGWVGAGPVTR
jgi:hypothetical protein